MNLLETTDWREFLGQLRMNAGQADSFDNWPKEQLSQCGQVGVHRWFAPREYQGWGWSEAEQVQGYLDLSRACLTTAFILTQRAGALRRIVTSENQTARTRWLPGLVSGEIFGTVGISHLTTSQQSRGKPALLAVDLGGGRFRLKGFSPWVTGAVHSQVLVVAATTSEGLQILVSVDTNNPGVRPGAGKRLVALSGSCTDRVDFQDVEVGPDDLLAGPVPDVMKLTSTGGTGGLQTSTLAIGLAREATDFLLSQIVERPSLSSIAEKMASDAVALEAELLEMARGLNTSYQQKLRQKANSFVIRATQAALTAAKGTGFVDDHPAGRWARQAMFFLVWSCPQAVLDANLCELAGLESF